MCGLDHHQAKHVTDSDFGSTPSDGHYHVVSSSGSGGGFCTKMHEEESGTVLVDTDCRSRHDSVEYQRLFDFEFEHLRRGGVVDIECHQFPFANGHCKFIPGVKNTNQGVTRVDHVVGASCKIVIPLGLASKFQPKGNRRSGERSQEMSTTCTNWTYRSCIQNCAIFPQNVKA